jgi:flagellar biosynthesis protein FlhA
VDPVTVLITHLGEVLRNEAPLLLSRAEVGHPAGGGALAPTWIDRGTGSGVACPFRTFSASCRTCWARTSRSGNIDLIVEALVDVARQAKEPGDLTERIRQKLGYSIFSALRGSHDALSVMSLSPRLETQLLDSVRRSETPDTFVIDPRTAEQLLKKLIPMVDDMGPASGCRRSCCVVGNCAAI